MNGIDIKSGDISLGSHILDIYAADRLINTASMGLNIIRVLFGTNHNNRILTTKKYPNKYPTGQPPSVPYANQLSVPTILQEMKSMGFNAVRINMYWEGYRWYKSKGQYSIFINRLKEIASTADSLGLGIVYNEFDIVINNNHPMY